MVPTHLLYLLNCRDYQHYLDTHIKDKDLYYLRSINYSRTLVTLGYRSTVELYTPEQFEKLTNKLKKRSSPAAKKSFVLYSCFLVSFDPVLRQLAQRELPNQQKILSTILFIKYRNKAGFEISGFIDYEQSLRERNMGEKDGLDWLGIFTERAKLRVRRTDLSYYNWHSGALFFNNSDNFVVSHDATEGLVFRHRGDRKRISATFPNSFNKENCEYSMAYSNNIGHVIFLDHVIRKKN